MPPFSMIKSVGDAIYPYVEPLIDLYYKFQNGGSIADRPPGGDDESGDDHSGDQTDHHTDDHSGDHSGGDGHSGDHTGGDDHGGDHTGGDDHSGGHTGGDDHSGGDHSGDHSGGDDGTHVRPPPDPIDEGGDTSDHSESEAIDEEEYCKIFGNCPGDHHGTDSHASSKDYTKAGLIMAINKNFFKNYKGVFLRSLMKSNTLLKIIPPIHETFMIPFLNIKCTNTDKNFKLAGLKYNEDRVTFNINERKPQLEIGLENMSMNFTWDYDLVTDPELIDEHGTVTIIVDNLSAHVSGSPDISYNADTYESVVNVDIDTVRFDSSQLTFEVAGGDIASLVNYFDFNKKIDEYINLYLMTNFKPAMK